MEDSFILLLLEDFRQFVCDIFSPISDWVFGIANDLSSLYKLISDFFSNFGDHLKSIIVILVNGLTSIISLLQHLFFYLRTLLSLFPSYTIFYIICVLFFGISLIFLAKRLL